MANLIIKSSADNLVLQGSDASPAITVGATGTTTFAENATLSGTANNLGTSTAGTFTSGVTFPSGTGTATGHVLQSQYAERTATYSNSTPGTDYYKPFSDTDCVITPISTSNKYFVSLSINSWWQQGNGGNVHRFVRLSYTPSGGTEVFFGACDYWASNYALASGAYGVAQGTIVKRIDVPSALATTFKFEIKSDTDLTHILPNGGVGVVSLTVTEVQA